jgi:peptidoglycan-N-acetylglucosamine deacetylase
VLVLLSNPHFYITTSWDDGHPLDLRLAGLLAKYGLPATFYIPLGNTRPLVSDGQLRELASQFEIGAHTISHCDLRQQSDENARREIGGCKEKLEQITGRPCPSFCFPKGRFRRHHLQYVRDAGFAVARTVELMSVSLPSLSHGLSLMPTTMQAAPWHFQTFARNSLKRFRLFNLGRYIWFKRSDWVEMAQAMLEDMNRNGGVFHLWGHSWEIDELGQWENLERAFALLQRYTDKAEFLDNSRLAQVGRSIGPEIAHAVGPR